MAEYREILEQEGQLIVSPATGSMRPMLRPKRDSVLLEPCRAVRPGDVLLFRRGEDVVLHRAIRPIAGGWFTRGDRSFRGEEIPEAEIIGVMRGFYRDERFVPADAPLYRFYAFWVVRLHPLLTLLWRARAAAGRLLKGRRDGRNSGKETRE